MKRLLNAAAALVLLIQPAFAQKTRAEFRWVNEVPKKFAADDLKHGTFASDIAGEDVGYCVLLPPAYDAEADRRFSVVYYLHGGRPGSETKGLGVVPKLREEFAAGAEPVIYVFVNGGPVSHYNVPAGGDHPNGARGRDVFTEELIPHIDATYRTIADREHRGLEGFSQGGRGTTRIGLSRPDLFASIAPGGSGFGPERRIQENDGEERPGLVFAKGDDAWTHLDNYAARESGPTVDICVWVGTKGFNYETNREFMAELDRKKIPHRQIVVEGAKHSATKIYAAKGRELMDFHAAVFAKK